MSKNDMKILFTAIGTGLTIVLGITTVWYFIERKKKEKYEDDIMDNITAKLFDID